MKKQQKTYILLAIVIVIWSIVIFQFFGYLNESEEEIPKVNYAKYTPGKITKKEDYKVSIHDRDPFLGTYRIVKKTVAKKKVVKKKEPIIFPPINYKGIVINGDNKSFIIAINGKQHIMKLGTEINGIKLISGNKKEIKIIYKGQRKTIVK